MTTVMNRSMTKYIAAALTGILVCIAAAAIPTRPQPPRLVNDIAGLFTASQSYELERTLVAFDDSTSNQITVVTVTDLEGYSPADLATRIGLDWGVGSSDFNNGIVILVKPKTTSAGQVFISIGYGLEGAIPDSYVKRIINNEMIPHFMENDYFTGVEIACNTLMQLASGEISEPRDYDDDDDMMFICIIMLITLILIILIIAAANNNGGSGNGGNRGRSILDGPVITIGNDFGGWGRTSGGFGGGSFGGGFGGFGGGSFGGGGAGGSW